jgi:hypothetical protein
MAHLTLNRGPASDVQVDPTLVALFFDEQGHLCVKYPNGRVLYCVLATNDPRPSQPIMAPYYSAEGDPQSVDGSGIPEAAPAGPASQPVSPPKAPERTNLWKQLLEP